MVYCFTLLRNGLIKEQYVIVAYKALFIPKTDNFDTVQDKAAVLEKSVQYKFNFVRFFF